MKRKRIFCFVFVAVIMIFSSCSPSPIAAATHTPEPTAAAATAAPSPSSTAAPTSSDNGVITIYSFTDEVLNIVEKYKALHPDFHYEINYPIGGMFEGYYQDALDQALTAKSPDAADIYCVEASFASKYTQGEMSGYALPYKDLFPDLEEKIATAKIAPYIVDVGTRPSDSALVGLAYQNTAGAFIYRRSIAKDVWGTDDPAVIASKIGPGWNKFFASAEDLKLKGYAIVSGDGDIWHPIQGSADKGWLVDGKLYIDPKRASFLDYAKELADKGYSNGTIDWLDGWYADMTGSGDKPVFGFFGPAWLINYVMVGHSGATFDDLGKLVDVGGTYGDWAVCEPTQNFFWGGTWVLANKTLNDDPAKKAAVAELIDWINLQCGKDSLQYLWANGKAVGTDSPIDTVASGTVMAMADGTLDFLGGQNMFDAFIPASQNINGKNITEFDDSINVYWLDEVRKYADGKCTRDEAIAAFKQQVKEQLHIDAAS